MIDPAKRKKEGYEGGYCFCGKQNSEIACIAETMKMSQRLTEQ